MAVWSSIARQRGVPSLLGTEVRAHAAPFSRVQPLQFRQAPLLFAAVAFALGILLQHFWRPVSTLVVAAALLLACAAAAVWRAPRFALPAVAVAWVVLGWTCAELQPRLVPSTAVLRYADGLRREVAGTVVDVEPLKPRPPEHGADPLRWDETRADLDAGETAAGGGETVNLQLQRIEEVTPDTATMVPVDGGVRLTVQARDSAGTGPRCGDLVQVTTRLRPPPEYRDPGVWRYPDYLAAAGISASGTARRADLKTTGSGAVSFSCRMGAMRHWASHRLEAFARWQQHLHLPALLRWTQGDAGLLDAMLFGDRRQLDRGLRVQFERTGSFHLFVVAGMHVGFVAGGLYAVLVWLRLPRFAATLLCTLGTLGYALLTGFGAPVQRAFWMTLAFLLARLLSRERSVLNALGLASLALLAARPQTLFDSAFQMTVLVIVAIGGVAMPLLDRTLHPYLHACRHLDRLRLDGNAPPRVAQFRVGLRFAGELLGRSLGAPFRHVPAVLFRLLLLLAELSVLSLLTELVMALPMAIYFHRVTPFALPANLLVVPLVPVLLAAAILTFLASLFSPWVALPPALLTAGLLRWTSVVIGGFGHLRTADWRVGEPPIAAIVTAVLLVGAAVLAVRRQSRAFAWTGLALAPLCMLTAVWPYPARLHASTLEVTAIDVGQGDSLLLVAPNRAAMLIDAGGQVGSEQAVRQTTFDTGESVVSPYLWSRGLRQLDVIALTHAHMDHLGGMLSTLDNFHPRELWVSVDADSAALRALTAEAAAVGTTVRHVHQGDRPEWAGGTVEVLAPEAQRPAGREPVNDDSLVLRVRYGQASALLAGDAEHPSEEHMEAAGLLQPVTLLKVGHHGSMTSTSDAFLGAVQPRVAVISCGRGNRFGHPRLPVLQRLQAAHVHTARTDTMGLSQFLLHADGTVETHFPAADERGP